MYKIKRFFNKIIKVFTFIPIIWDDEDWDYTYMLELLTAKLIFMKKYFLHSDTLAEESNKEILAGLEKTLKYLDDFLNYDTGRKELEPPFDVAHISVPTKDGIGYQFITVMRETGKELSKEEEVEYGNYLKECVEKEQECWEAIFNTIRDEGRRWWD